MKASLVVPRKLLLWPTILGLAVASAVVVYIEWPQPRPAVLWREAQDALRASRIDDAAELLERLTKLRPPEDHDWVLRAQVAMARGRSEDALADLGMVPDTSHVAIQARLLAGQLALRLKRLPSAEEQLRRAIAIDPKNPAPRRELVYLLGMQTRRQELGEQMRALAELEPLTYDHLFLWCLTRGSVWESNEIVDFMTQCLKADPTDKWSRIALADSLENQGRLEEAETALKPLANTDPEARAARARIAFDRGDIDGAEALLAEGPMEHAALARLRGRMALLKRDGQAAVRHFRAADAAEPNNRDTTLGLAQALRLAGDADAERVAERARAHDALQTLMQHAATAQGRADPNLPLRLGAAHEAIGRRPEARAWYQLAIDRNPLDPKAQEALNRLRVSAASSE